MCACREIAFYSDSARIVNTVQRDDAFLIYIMNRSSVTVLYALQDSSPTPIRRFFQTRPDDVQIIEIEEALHASQNYIVSNGDLILRFYTQS